MEELTQLAELVGISSSYVDKVGHTHFTTDEVRKFFLNIMGYKCNQAEISAQIAELKKDKILPEVLTFFENEKIEIKLNSDEVFELLLLNEQQNVVWQKQVDGNENIALSDLPFGYYQLQYKSAENYGESLLIYAPTYCYHPEFLRQHEHLFGTAVMLYALRSEHNMGIGDFSDLAEIVRLTAQNGGDVVGINPLGVMSPYMHEKCAVARQGDVSPYRTLDRMFVNYVYLDLTVEADFIAAEQVRQFMMDEKTQSKIASLNGEEKVNYAEVLELKLRILEMMFAQFNRQATTARKEKFARFCVQKGRELDNLSAFECLLEKMQPENFWRFWSGNYADVNSSEVREFKDQNRERMRFYKYCHWLADLQVKKVQKQAKELGMKIGLYADMPIGAASNGAEVWENPQAFVLDATIGAPADPMRPRGQSWGFNPYHPQELQRQHYAPFIRLVRENMQNAGALRIDHAMGVRRLFWGFFTADNPVVQGAYVYYNIKDLVAILCIESNRQKCLVIGEDLGTVPDGFREYMAEHGLLSYKVFCRQKEKDGSFVEPEKYMYMSLAQTSTHDQATACGFWRNEDIEVFHDCNLYVNQAQYQSNLQGRRNDRHNMIRAFAKQNMLSAEDEKNMERTAESGNQAPQQIHRLINLYGAKTGSALFLVRLNDIYRQEVLDNAPGTVEEYPNWRIKMNVTIEEIKKSAEFAAMMQMIKQNRPQ